MQNILGIIDTSGNLVVKYSCNAYGDNQTITGDTTLGNRNPFRYKGYYYDSETNMYYCKSRYYNPLWCRWLTPDSIEYLEPENHNGLNLFMYCGNNPVVGYDPSGNWNWGSFWKTALGVAVGIGLVAVTVVAVVASGGTLLAPVLIGSAIGMASSVVGQGIGNLITGKEFFEDISVASVVMGAISGAAFATGIGGLFGAVVIGAVSNAGTSALEQKCWANIGLSLVVGGVASGLGHKVGSLIANQVFKNNGLVFKDIFELGLIDCGFIRSAFHAFLSSWYTFLPNIGTGITRGGLKALGNMGVSCIC